MNSFYNKRALISWSGGKDSCYALHMAIQNGIKPVALITVINEEKTLSKSNGVPISILKAQADALDLPIVLTSASWENYEHMFIVTLKQAKINYNANCIVFGDIDIIEHKEFEEKVSRLSKLEAILPIWGLNRDAVASGILRSKICAKISVIRNDIVKLECLGKKYTSKLFDYLEKNKIDICGENGEFHTLVYKSPLFKEKIDIKTDKLVTVGNYSFNLYKLIYQG